MQTLCFRISPQPFSEDTYVLRRQRKGSGARVDLIDINYVIVYVNSNAGYYSGIKTLAAMLDFHK